ncbi:MULTISPECIES: hypothetical protein [Derxia]|uniref:Uncharacterized protein n=1 Tax=Derxia gummosa DSM 723 TaxID=1121388 RepID=A0A8B6X718_9BURK|nr:MULTISPECIES: hypothetical protein [Derxia]
MSDLSSLKAAQARGPVATPLAAAVAASSAVTAASAASTIAAAMAGAPAGSARAKANAQRPELCAGQLLPLPANPLARAAVRGRRLFVAAVVVSAPIGWGIGALGLLGHWALG